MKTIAKIILSLALLLAFSLQPAGFAQGTAFTYQGRLNAGGGPANGTYDLTFSLYNVSSNGSAVAGPQPVSATAVSNGLFTVVLDFGAGVFDGTAYWLEIGVRTNGGGTFSALGPRQAVTSTPYAVQSLNAASAGSVAAGNITGALTAAQLPPSVVTNGASGVNFSGTFSGNGAGVTNVGIGTLNAPGILAWGNFVYASSPVVGSAAFSVVAADVNGDGRVDLISANLVANTLTVLTNNGKGSFGLSSSPSVGSGPRWVAAADVNGDGKLDLISANNATNTLSVLTNNGTGGFVLSSSPVVGSGPYSVVAADVNGDNRMDLISANSTANTLTVLTNNGTGGFVLSSSPVVGSGPYSVVAADVNGDGKVDLISANYGVSGNGNTLSVLTNNGSGGFVLAALPAVGAGPRSVVATDVNGDGKIDLISANSTANTLSVLTNNGSGGFALASSPSVAGPYSVVAADVNGDGKVDLIIATGLGDLLVVLTNNGSGGFVLSSSLSVGIPAFSVVAADVNGDSRVDLIGANSSGLLSGTLSVFFNTPTFVGDGSGLTALNASQLLSGTLPDARLSANVPSLSGGKLSDSVLSTNVALLNATQTFTGTNTFNGDQNFTGTNSIITLDNTVSLFAKNSSGTPENFLIGRWSDNVTYLNYGSGGLIVRNNTNTPMLTMSSGGNAAFTGPVSATAFTGDGSGLTSLTAGNLSLGTVPDARLSANVALLNATQTFTGINTFNNAVRIGAGNMLEFGAGVAGKEANAGKIGYQTFTADALDITGAGTNSLNRKIKFWAEGGSVFTGNVLASGSICASNGVVCVSDRNAKENFTPVNAREVLKGVTELALSRWSYKTDPGVTHLGPVAQDFYSAFGLGTDDKHIATVDADGVALAAIQGLNEKVEVRNQKSDDRIKKLEAENAELRHGFQQKETEITELEQRLDKLERLMRK